MAFVGSFSFKLYLMLYPFSCFITSQNCVLSLPIQCTCIILLTLPALFDKCLGGLHVAAWRYPSWYHFYTILQTDNMPVSGPCTHSLLHFPLLILYFTGECLISCDSVYFFSHGTTLGIWIVLCCCPCKPSIFFCGCFLIRFKSYCKHLPILFFNGTLHEGGLLLCI